MPKDKKTILLVDDEQETLSLLSKTLERQGYETITASTAGEALELAKFKKPHLIILDIVMPDLSGGEVAVILENDSATAHIPIIFLTGIMGKDEETIKIKAGRQYKLIAKPVVAEELIEKVNGFFN